MTTRSLCARPGTLEQFTFSKLNPNQNEPYSIGMTLIPVLATSGRVETRSLVQHGFHLVDLTFQRFIPKFHTSGFRRNRTSCLYPLREFLRIGCPTADVGLTVLF